MQVFRSNSNTASLASDLPVPLAAPVSVVARMVIITAEGWTDKSALIVAQQLLSRGEQASWAALPPSARRRGQWLAGRLAVKDAVRFLVEQRTGASVHPAAIEVIPDHRGAPRVSLQDPSLYAAALHISIAHTADRAVALVSDDPRLRGVGIDVERSRPRRALERKGLTADERRALGHLPEPLRAETALRWWCAKEATAKALGTGLDLLGGAQAITVAPMPGNGGEVVQVTVAGSADRATCLMQAATQLDGDLVLATACDWLGEVALDAGSP